MSETLPAIREPSDDPDDEVVVALTYGGVTYHARGVAATLQVDHDYPTGIPGTPTTTLTLVLTRATIIGERVEE